MKTRHILGALLMGLMLVTLPAVAQMPMQVGKTVKLSLDKGAKGEFSVTLPPGDYLALLDSRLMSGRKGFLRVTVGVRDGSGGVVNAQFMSASNVYRPVDRQTRAFEMKREMPLRFQILNDGDTADVWLTVQTRGAEFLPFPFAAELRPMTIGPAGNRGTLDFDKTVYFAVAVPAGNWNLTVGLQTTGAKERHLGVQVDLLDPYGGTRQDGYIAINEVGRQASRSRMFSFARPHTVMIALTSAQVAPEEHLTYTVSLEKAAAP